MTRQCVVCGKEVPQGYESDHLKANHLGPHEFWFDARKFTTMIPSMTGGELKKLANAPAHTFLFEERRGGDIAWGDGVSVDLTQKPHFYTLIPATY